MREIKFRAWDNEAKVMRQVTDLALNWEEGPRPTYIHSEGTLGGEMRTLRGYDCIVMQFAGLHDKNGKEIYEGDIVKGTIYADMEVIWGKDGWILKRRSEDLFPLGVLQKQNTEVIGNIYENPELLK